MANCNRTKAGTKVIAKKVPTSKSPNPIARLLFSASCCSLVFLPGALGAVSSAMPAKIKPLAIELTMRTHTAETALTKISRL